MAHECWTEWVPSLSFKCSSVARLVLKGLSLQVLLRPSLACGNSWKRVCFVHANEALSSLPFISGQRCPRVFLWSPPICLSNQTLLGQSPPPSILCRAQGFSLVHLIGQGTYSSSGNEFLRKSDPQTQGQLPHTSALTFCWLSPLWAMVSFCQCDGWKEWYFKMGFIMYFLNLPLFVRVSEEPILWHSHFSE